MVVWYLAVLVAAVRCHAKVLTLRYEMSLLKSVWYGTSKTVWLGMVLVGAPPSHKLFLAAVLLFIGGPQITPQRPKSVVTSRE